ncbi:MAG: S24 family peptidase [bacterium]
MTIAERLKQVQKDFNLTQIKFAEIAGLSQSIISKYLKEERFPSESILYKIANELNISYDWLMTGTGDMKDKNAIAVVENNCYKIPIINASAGGGAYNEVFDIIDISKAELAKMGYKKADRLTAVKIFNNSMYPTINDGDLLIADIDVDYNFIRDKDIYVLRFGDRFFCKRLLCGLKTITIKSDNPDYPPEHISGDEVTSLNIIGKVVYRMTAFQK